MKTNNDKKTTWQSLLSMFTVLIGMLLMVFKIYADSEPGAIPLLLILVGGVWYFATRVKLRVRV